MSNITLATQVIQALKKVGKTLSTAESCTGGLIAKLLTDIPGSSAAFSGGVVSYTNAVKMNILGVSADTINVYTEVSAPCAMEMATGVAKALGTDLGISATGFAGPGGGNEADPVGTVYLGLYHSGKAISYRYSAPAGSDREQVRKASACMALEMVLNALSAEDA